MNIKDTVFLPKTNLPMKAKPEVEVATLQRWDTLYDNIRQARSTSLPWRLHDGPPYANGNIHVGHALNKTLKDILVRGHNALGFDAPYVPGWDCHGLPIEWKVEEQWRKEGRDKAVDPTGFRLACREYAQGWVNTQSEQFKRLGVLADWDSPSGTYRTMQPEWESGILHAFHDIVRKGLVYRANKPVMWSPAEKTALADAETVEREHIVPNIWVRFLIASGPLADVAASLLVWTTTPWSLVGNVGVAFNPTISYGLYEAPTGFYVVAKALVDQALPDEDYEWVRDVTIDDLMIGDRGRLCAHPLGDHYEPSRIIPADFVREGSGTGFVHVGPAHSAEDWAAWRAYDPDASFPNPVLDNGVFAEDVPHFGGMAVTKGKKMGPANQEIVDHLLRNGMLYQRDDRPLTLHHSWRSDAVLITRATPQVFIDLKDARMTAVDELSGVKFTPEHARHRMTTMLKNRPDWLISRQRLWGTPLGLFVNKATGAICDDPAVLAATHQMLADVGSEEWFNLTVEDMFSAIGRDDADRWDRLDDVLDVWFDSGCVSVMMGDKADLVIEGSDQFRGWFSSSLLVSVLLGREAPFREVLAHGFVLDRSGFKMSKSAGNVLDPLKVIEKHGADVLRVWVASTDVTEDIRVSDSVMDTHAESARKIRNTMRYMVGALHDYTPAMDGLDNDAPELERYIRHRMFITNTALAEMLQTHNLTQYMATIVNFCVNDLSSLLFDIRKDTLYCDARSSPKRRAYRDLLNQLFHHMAVWIAPVMPFAAEELYQARYPAPYIAIGPADEVGLKNPRHTVHLQGWPKAITAYRDDALAEKWGRVIEYRSMILSKIEEARAEGFIKSSNEVALTVMVQPGSLVHQDLEGMDLAELSIAGAAVMMAANLTSGDIEITVDKVLSPRCDRCWLSRPVMKMEENNMCERCADAV